MDHTPTYKLTWTRDPGRESVALLIALRGRILQIFIAVAVVAAILVSLLHIWFLTVVIIVVAVAIPFSARSKIRRSFRAGDPNVRVAMSGRGVRLGKGEVVPWSEFTHWKRMKQDIVLLQQHGRRVGAGLLIPLDAIPEHDREGLFDLLDRQLKRAS